MKHPVLQLSYVCSRCSRYTAPFPCSSRTHVRTMCESSPPSLGWRFGPRVVLLCRHARHRRQPSPFPPPLPPSPSLIPLSNPDSLLLARARLRSFLLMDDSPLLPSPPLCAARPGRSAGARSWRSAHGACSPAAPCRADGLARRTQNPPMRRIPIRLAPPCHNIPFIRC